VPVKKTLIAGSLGFCLQHLFYHALHAAKHSLCYFFSAAAPIFAMARICGAVPGKPAFPGLYQIGAGRL